MSGKTSSVNGLLSIGIHMADLRTGLCVHPVLSTREQEKVTADQTWRYPDGYALLALLIVMAILLILCILAGSIISWPGGGILNVGEKGRPTQAVSEQDLQR